MRDDGQRRHDAQVRVGQEGGGDDHAVAEVVDAVADQHAPAAAAGLLGVEAVVVVVVRVVAFVVVAVAVQLGLLEQEEEQQAAAAASRTAPARRRSLSKASGSTCSSAVPSSTPTDRLTRLLTMRPEHVHGQAGRRDAPTAGRRPAVASTM